LQFWTQKTVVGVPASKDSSNRRARWRGDVLDKNRVAWRKRRGWFRRSDWFVGLLLM